MKIDQKKVIALSQIEYLVINKNFLIQELSPRVGKFADPAEKPQVGSDVRLSFPELFGLEDLLSEIIDGRKKKFDLKGIARSSAEGNLLYFDLYFQGEEDRLLLVIQDVTESKIIEQRLVQGANEYSLLLNDLSAAKDYVDKIISAMLDALLVTTKTGKIKTANRAAVEIFGYEREELIGKPISVILSEDRENFLPENLLDKYSEVTCVKKTGEQIFVAFSGAAIGGIAPATQAAYRKVGVAIASEKTTNSDLVFIGRDITKRKQIEMQLFLSGKQSRFLRLVSEKLRESLKLEEIFNSIVTEVRDFFECDRVLIYQFLPGSTLTSKAEVVADRSIPELVNNSAYPQFESNLLQAYRQGKLSARSNLETANFAPSYLETLKEFSVQSELVIPILCKAALVNSQLGILSRKLWGFLIVHQTQIRVWQKWEIDLIEELVKQLAIAIQQAELYQQLQLTNQELTQLAIIDPLTKLANRRAFEERLIFEWCRLYREQQPLSLILCDLDYGKAYLDTYGLLAGDFCLQEIANILSELVKRSADFVARYGGDEFAIILPNTSQPGAIHVAETICLTILEKKIPHQRSLASAYLSLSLGVASMIPDSNYTPENLVEAADRALKQAKETGRSRVVAAHIMK
ncbi:MAG: diguanylate cyclase [Oscillatoria sp. PMC 1051.18]|nr:diguanylate cyclase [Oscillatoria sp. PMC 1050.18]MEC5028454.1 diguanylate cyclase [Oscillatoria sp. PMC 1051.18]